MSINDIKKMPIQERMQLMEVLLESFSSDEETMKSPEWHKDVLKERAIILEQDAVKMYTLAELKAKR